jgi:4-amino-4-deoxy-L-arabinose transferase-like glycosyltransferase
LILAVSVAWEGLFLHFGINKLDEGWTLYAAKRLHEGAVLYRDVMFPFPPGHLLAAWLGYAIEPPGVVVARIVYAAFSVGASLGVYLLGRKIMPAHFALWGALLLAIAAPRSHLSHLLFGYRYALFAILALLAFSRRVDGRGARWMFVAGLCAGTGLIFRLTPAATASVAIAVGLLLADPRPKVWLRDGALYAAGLLAVALPVGLWFASQVGLETLWREVLLRPVAMTQEQSLPIPDLAALPGTGRRQISRWFVALQFRLWTLLYIGYGLAAGSLAWRALRDRAASQHAVFVAIVVWGAIFFFRALGRSDEPHLDSALPPVCLLLAHLFFSLARRLGSEPTAALAPRQWRARESRRPRLVAVAVALFAAWVFLGGSDYYMPREQRGRVPSQAMSGEVAIPRAIVAQALDWSMYAILTWSQPGEPVLDLTASPLLHVLSGRNGIAFSDPLIPGSFLSDEEELRYVEALERRPPAVVLRPQTPFDRNPERAIEATAPRVAAWVDAHYRVEAVRSGIIVLVPAGS